MMMMMIWWSDDQLSSFYSVILWCFMLKVLAHWCKVPWPWLLDLRVLERKPTVCTACCGICRSQGWRVSYCECASTIFARPRSTLQVSLWSASSARGMDWGKCYVSLLSVTIRWLALWAAGCFSIDDELLHVSRRVFHVVDFIKSSLIYKWWCSAWCTRIYSLYRDARSDWSWPWKESVVMC